VTASAFRLTVRAFGRDHRRARVSECEELSLSGGQCGADRGARRV